MPRREPSRHSRIGAGLRVALGIAALLTASIIGRRRRRMRTDNPPAGPGEAPRASGFRRWELIGVIGGVVGALAATYTLVVAQRMNILLTTKPFYPTSDYQRFVVRTIIVNDSARAANLRNATLYEGDQVIARSVALVPDVGGGEAPELVTDDALMRQATDAPVHLGPGAATLSALILEYDGAPAAQRFRNTLRSAASRPSAPFAPSTCDLLEPSRTGSSSPPALAPGTSDRSSSVPSRTSPLPTPTPGQSPARSVPTPAPSPEPAGNLRLALEFTPGGTKSIDVGYFNEGRLFADSTLNDSVEPGWSVRLEVTRQGDVSALSITHETVIAQLRPRLVSVDVWSHRGRSRVTVAHPNPSCVPLPRLAAGPHDWAVRSEGRTLATGRFWTPCPVPRTADEISQLPRGFRRVSEPPFSCQEPPRDR